MLYRRLVRGLLVLAALLALGGALAPRVASAVWPRYRVWTALPLVSGSYGDKVFSFVARRPAGRDPWGRPWAERPLRVLADRHSDLSGPQARSVGPDGVDDGGAGDDVVLDPAMERVARAPSRGAQASLLVLWLVAVIQALASGRGPALWHDVLRATIAASPLVVSAAMVVSFHGVPRALDGLPLLVPPELATLGAAAFVLVLAALGWRVRRGVPRRARARVGSGLGAAGALLVAWAASAHGLELHSAALHEQRQAVFARLGVRWAIERLLEGDEATLEAYLALEPDVEWQLFSPGALGHLTRLGPRSGPYLARALRWRGQGLEVRGDVWRAALAHDFELRALARALADEPDRYPGLLVSRPRLAAALVGAERVRAALRPLQEHVQLPFEEVAVDSEQAALIGRRAAEGVRRIGGGDDAWIVVRAQGLVPTFGELRCGATLDAGQESTFAAPDGDACVLVLLGPLPRAEAGRRLAVRDLATNGRAVVIELPAPAAHETLWVEARLDAGTAHARPTLRPTSSAVR